MPTKVPVLLVRFRLHSQKLFLAPSGAQGVAISVRPSRHGPKLSGAPSFRLSGLNIQAVLLVLSQFSLSSLSVLSQLSLFLSHKLLVITSIT